MDRFIIDYNEGEVETIQVDVPFTSREGMFQDLPNGTEIFLTERYLRHTVGLFDMLKTPYEGIDVASVFPPPTEEK